MKKIALLLALLAPVCSSAGEYDGVYACTIAVTGYGNISTFASIHTHADGSAAFVQATPIRPSMSVYGYAIGSFSGSTFTGISGNDNSTVTLTFSGTSLSFSDSFAYNGTQLPALYSCSKVW